MKLLLLLLLTLCVARQLVAAGSDDDAIGRCPSGLPSTTAMKVFRDVCYQFVSEERYWTSARDYCIQVCSRLDGPHCISCPSVHASVCWWFVPYGLLEQQAGKLV